MPGPGSVPMQTSCVVDTGWGNGSGQNQHARTSLCGNQKGTAVLLQEGACLLLSRHANCTVACLHHPRASLLNLALSPWNSAWRPSSPQKYSPSDRFSDALPIDITTVLSSTSLVVSRLSPSSVLLPVCKTFCSGRLRNHPGEH